MPIRGHQDDDHSWVDEALEDLGDLSGWGLAHCGHAIFLAFDMSELATPPNWDSFAARIGALGVKEVPSSEWCRYNTGSSDPEEQIAAGWIKG
jgi:hypothetical protein